MAHQGLRVLAFACRKLAVGYDRERLEQDLVFAGLAGLEDPPRPEVPEALRKCQEAGIKVIMVTGDHPRTAAAIAREIGLVKSDNPTIITGEQLRRFSVIQLQLALDAQEVIFARVVADQKMRIVEALKKKRQIVAVTGDGVNDAPALKAAHIGIAMGIAGTDVAKEAADMVLLDDNFASIVNAVEEGRAVFENIRKFLTYVLVHNVAELIPYLGFLLFKIPLALTPIQALSIDMGSDTLTALGLGVERPDPQIMRRPPRPQGERLMNWPLAFRAYLFLGLIEAAAAMAAFFFVLNGAGWKYGQNLAAQDPVYLQATTACLSAIIVMQIVNVFLCRSATRSVFSTGLSWQSADHFGRDVGNCHPPLDQLHALGKFSPRNGTHWRGGLGLRHSFRGRHVHSGGAAQVACPQETAQSLCPWWLPATVTSDIFAVAPERRALCRPGQPHATDTAAAN